MNVLTNKETHGTNFLVRMAWVELRALFQDTVAEALPAGAVAKVVDLVAGLDVWSRPREITAAMVSDPDWLERNG